MFYTLNPHLNNINNKYNNKPTFNIPHKQHIIVKSSKKREYKASQSFSYISTKSIKKIKHQQIQH